MRNNKFCVFLNSRIKVEILASEIPSGFGCSPFYGCGSAVIYSMFVVAPIVCGVYCYAFVLQ